jgi:hypothetical protein
MGRQRFDLCFGFFGGIAHEAYAAKSCLRFSYPVFSARLP